MRCESHGTTRDTGGVETDELGMAKLECDICKHQWSEPFDAAMFPFTVTLWSHNQPFAVTAHKVMARDAGEAVEKAVRQRQSTTGEDLWNDLPFYKTVFAGHPECLSEG